jgi:cysteinyl-tRNA synthetase
MIRLYSTLQRAQVPLEPRTEGEIGFYVCGPTVQSPPHVGHGRSAVVFDVIRRYLLWSGYRVTFVRNITDIEDKIIAKAAESGEDVATYATRMSAEFADGYHRLGVLDPDIEPLATEHIAEMHELISALIDQGKAYQAGDDVYFSVRSDEDYGKLSNQNLDEMRSGTRIEPNEVKHDPLDFALWKGAKPGEPYWDSPWGPGRPGWHIECSAMAARYLGNDFDIHSGGTDLIFPHHENEIAQSECATGERLARYWLHNGMVNLGGAKMAKSTGNVVDLITALDKYGGMALRLLFVRAHYRAPIEYSEALVEEAAEAYRRIERLLERVPESSGPPAPEVIDAFRAAMDDDFATPAAVGTLFDAIREANRMLDEGEDASATVAAVRELVEVLGLDQDLSQTASLDREALAELATAYGVDPSGDAESTVEGLLAVRADARADRDFARADAIRDRLADVDVVVEDTPDGARWVRG